jgi:hypothetical protein
MLTRKSGTNPPTNQCSLKQNNLKLQKFEKFAPAALFFSPLAIKKNKNFPCGAK